MARTNTRDVILDAAEQVIARDGVRDLTIGRVAEEAQVSRGGLFYHFASKEALIEGMVERMVARWQEALDAMIARDPEPHGRLTRSYARLVLLVDGGAEPSGTVMGALLAGLAFDPHLLNPLHMRLKYWQQQSEAELDAVTAAVVRLTTHALWTNPVLLTNDISPALLREIVARLEEMTYSTGAR